MLQLFPNLYGIVIFFFQTSFCFRSARTPNAWHDLDVTQRAIADHWERPTFLKFIMEFFFVESTLCWWCLPILPAPKIPLVMNSLSSLTCSILFWNQRTPWKGRKLPPPRKLRTRTRNLFLYLTHRRRIIWHSSPLFLRNMAIANTHQLHCLVISVSKCWSHLKKHMSCACIPHFIFSYPFSITAGRKMLLTLIDMMSSRHLC